jgi:hypothetical protein
MDRLLKFPERCAPPEQPSLKHEHGSEAKSAGSGVAAHGCRRKFLRIFPKGFRDETYLAWERNYKMEAHQRWNQTLDRPTFRRLLRKGEYAQIAALAVGVEARTHLIFSFEKMALRDAIRPSKGAQLFAKGLYDYLYGSRDQAAIFERWCATVASLPRKQSRVSTWPIITVFGFLAQPTRHIYLKPNVTRRAATAYGFPFHYESRPSWKTYASILQLAAVIRTDLKDLRPRDMIDIQSFIWVMGSEEYD